jgi:ricin-type beta-trefoil lectin protein/cellulase (glycosyl hydrolase family 5)
VKTPRVAWRKTALIGVGVAALAAVLALAPQALVHAASASSGAKPPAGYTPIKTRQGMCLDDTAGIGRDGQPVQLWNCLGDRNQAWQAEPDGTIRNANGWCLGAGTAANHYAATANGTRLVMVACSRDYLGSYWTMNSFAHQIVNKYATAAMDNQGDAQRDGNRVQIWVAGSPASDYWIAVPSGGSPPAVTPGGPPALHTDGANMVTASGQVFVPRGFTLSTLEFTAPYLDGANAYASVLSETEAQLDAIAGAWHGNIVRFQIEQDYLVQSEAAGDSSYLDLIRAVVGYAKSKGLVVVLNAQTEPGSDSVPQNEPLPTQNEPLPTQETVEFWQLLQPYYGNDASVIIDVFNEPRPDSGTTVQQYMTLWKDGGEYQGVSYLGHQQLVETLRADGYAQNMLWVEPPGNYGLSGLTQTTGTTPGTVSPAVGRQETALAEIEQDAAVLATADPGKFLLTGVSNISYSFHHPTVLGSPRTQANWDAQFGDLVKNYELSVNDGEWATRAQNTGFVASNGDSGPCWSDAPTAVPRYFAYLQELGVGLTSWTLSDGAPGIGTTAAADPGTFTTTATMANWPGCENVTPVDGPGALIMAWFGQQAS